RGDEVLPGLHIALGGGGTSAAAPLIRDLAGLLDALLGKRYLLLLSPPGGGKTTILHRLTLLLIGLWRGNRSRPLPVFVPLARFAPGGAGAPDALQMIRSWVVERVGEDNVVAARFLELAQAGRFVFLLDGLDQLPLRLSQTVKLDRLRKLDKEISL